MDEVGSKKYEKYCKEQEVENLEAENERIKGIISRLETAKETINTSDNDLRSYRSNIKNDYELYEDSWKGTEFNKYKALIDTEIYDSLYYTYINSGVNEVLDDLCDLITSYENQIYENQGIIGRLKSAINSLANEIEKLINNL